MATATMNKEQLAGFFKEFAGPIIAEAVEQAVATRLEGLEKRQTDWMERAYKAPSDQPVVKLGPDGKPLKALGLTKFLGAIVFAKNDPARAAQIARGMYKDEGLGVYFDGVAKALSAGEGAAGGFIVPPAYSTEIIELLYPQSVVRAAGPGVVQMPNGTLRYPKLTGGASATYIGENAAITASQQTFGQLVLTFKKLAALVPLSNDLIRFSSPSADAVVRDDIVRQIASAENSAFLRNDGTASTPKGLRYWVDAARLVTSAGTSLANMVTDMGALIQALLNANVPITRGAWFMSPRTWWSLYSVQTTTGAFVFRDEMMRGTLIGYPFFRSTQIPTTLGAGTSTEMYLVDMADVVIGEAQDLRIDASAEAAYVDSSGTVVAAYSQDQTIVRAITEHDIAMRRSESIAVLQTVAY